MLDIIVTHYDEPWETGKKLFYIPGCCNVRWQRNMRSGMP